MSNIFTVWNSVTIRFNTEASESVYTVILSGHIYNITHTTTYLLWDSNGLNTELFQVGLNEGDSIEIDEYEVAYSVRWDGIENSQHVLTITVDRDETCGTSCRCGCDIDPTLAETLYEKVQINNEYPSGNWADFNKNHKRWQFYRNLCFICPEYMADEIRIEDYVSYAIGSGNVTSKTKRVTAGTNDIPLNIINDNINAFFDKNESFSESETSVGSSGYTEVLSLETGSFDFIGVEIESSASSLAPLSELIIQFKDHEDGGWYSWIGNSDWINLAVDPIITVTRTTPKCGLDFLLDFGVASQGTVAVSGTSTVSGDNIEDGSIYSDSSISLTNTTISGDLFTSGTAADITLTPPNSVAGETNPALILANHLFAYENGIEYPQFDDVEMAIIKATATNVYAGRGRETVLTNVIIPPGTNPSFNKDMNLNGTIYVQSPNRIKFNGSVNLNCIFITDESIVTDFVANLIVFNGSVTFNGVESLGDTPEFQIIKEYVYTAFLAPSFKIEMRGALTTNNASNIVAGGNIILGGAASGTLSGQILALGDSAAVDIGGNPTIDVKFPPNDTTIPNKVDAGEKSFFRLNIHKPYALRIIAKTSSQTALITCRGYTA